MLAKCADRKFVPIKPILRSPCLLSVLRVSVVNFLFHHQELAIVNHQRVLCQNCACCRPMNHDLVRSIVPILAIVPGLLVTPGYDVLGLQT